MIRKMRSSDILTVVDIHITALPDDFLPSLGKEFLNFFYSLNLESSGVINLVFTDGENVKGFILGCTDSRKFFINTIKKNWLKLALLIGKRLIKNPSLIFKIIETFLYPKKEGEGPKPELLIVAVLPDFQEKGIGSQLVKSLEKEFKKKGIKKYKVSTLKQYRQANAFYRKLGFKFKSRFWLYNKAWNIYVKKLV